MHLLSSRSTLTAFLAGFLGVLTGGGVLRGLAPGPRTATFEELRVRTLTVLDVDDNPVGHFGGHHSGAAALTVGAGEPGEPMVALNAWRLEGTPYASLELRTSPGEKTGRADEGRVRIASTSGRPYVYLVDAQGSLRVGPGLPEARWELHLKADGSEARWPPVNEDR